jgi:excisionase family DNA binding protein
MTPTLAPASTPPQPPRLLWDRKTAAHLLSISVRSLDYLIADGSITVLRTGRRVLISRDELVRFATPEPPSQPLSDSEVEQWVADVQASYAAGTLPKWQIRCVEKIAGWKWDAEFGSKGQGCHE